MANASKPSCLRIITSTLPNRNANAQVKSFPVTTLHKLDVTLSSVNQPETPLSQEKQKEKDGRSSVALPQWNDSPVKLARRQLIGKRTAERAAELVKQDDEVIVKLEDFAIERSKAVDSAVLGKYNIWRKENENENDSTVRLMRDQIIMARVYLSIAKMKNKFDLYQELQTRLKESQRVLGEATSDADLYQSEHEKMKVMGQVLSKAKDQLYDRNSPQPAIRSLSVKPCIFRQQHHTTGCTYSALYFSS
ncbi:hypothetical protein RYX36_030197 [Vicia faba]